MFDNNQVQIEKIKYEKKIKKLKGVARTINTLEKYKELFSDPLVDRDILEIILERLESKTALKNYYHNKESKLILKLIVNHPLITAEDILRIKKVKTDSNKYSKATSFYNSSHINTALVKKPDTPKNTILTLVKLAQFDIKIHALGRNDLDKTDINMILEYAIKQHSHNPIQMKKLLDVANKSYLLKDESFNKKIIETLKKKYQKYSNWRTKPTGIKFFVIILEYGWMDYLNSFDKDEMFSVVVDAYKNKSVTKKMINKMAINLGKYSGEFLLKIYNETNDDSFFPKTAKEIFLF